MNESLISPSKYFQMTTLTNEQIVNELLTLKANSDVVSNGFDKLIKKLNPSPVKKRNGLTDEEAARILAKARKTRLKQISSK